MDKVSRGNSYNVVVAFYLELQEVNIFYSFHILSWMEMMLEFSCCALIVLYLVIFHYIFTFFFVYGVFQLPVTLAERRDGPNPPLWLFLYSDSSLVQLQGSLGYFRQFLESSWNLAIRLQIQTPCTGIKPFLSLHTCSEGDNVPWASSEVVHFCFALKKFRWMEWYCPEKLYYFMGE